jgi:hypothetical protein
MLKKIEKVGSRDILSDGLIQIRIDTEIWDDDELISTTYWREVIAPGQDVSDRAPEIQRLARMEHTPAVVKAYIDRTRPEIPS